MRGLRAGSASAVISASTVRPVMHGVISLAAALLLAFTVCGLAEEQPPPAAEPTLATGHVLTSRWLAADSTAPIREGQVVVAQSIYARRAVHEYTDEPVDEAMLRRLSDAAIEAPSAGIIPRKPFLPQPPLLLRAPADHDVAE
jgi:hypothetical protein